MRWETITLIFSLGVRSLFRNKRRTVLSLGAVAAGVCSSMVLASLARGLSANIGAQAVRNLTGHIQIHHKEYLNDPVVDNTFASPDPAALAVDGVVATLARVRVPGVLMSERDSAGTTVVGIDPAAEGGFTFLNGDIREGRSLSGVDDEGLVIGKRQAQYLQTAVGRRLVVMTQGADGRLAERGVKIVGIFDSELESTERAYAFMGRGAVQRLLGVKSEVSEISLLVDEERLGEVAVQLQHRLPDLDVKTWKELAPFVVALREIQGGFLRFWFGIVVIAVTFGLVNTLFMSVLERTREIGLVQALGMRPVEIVLQVLVESLLLIIVGAVVGTVAGAGSIAWLSGGVDLSRFASGTERFGVARTLFPQFLWSDYSIMIFLVFLVGSIGAVFPALRAGRLSPVEAFTRKQ